MNGTNAASPGYDFSGSIPHHYDRYMGPLFMEPYALEIASRINPGQVHDALELACGTGRVTAHLYNLLSPGTTFIASDLSADMLAVAKEKLPNENINWQIIDAQELPFADNSFDLLVCCFGFMFVPDKSKAFSEAYRVLRPNGMLIFTTWDKLDAQGASSVYRNIAKKYLTDPVAPVYKLPFSMYDDAAIQNLLQEAGFSKTQIEKVSKLSVSSTAEEAAIGLTQGGTLHRELMSRNPAWVQEIKEQVQKELTEKYGAAPMVAPMSALVTQAWK